MKIQKSSKGYSDKTWGLTAGDSYKKACSALSEVDLGVIQPMPQCSSMPYTPKERIRSVRNFYFNLGDKVWTQYGFVDGFSISHWYG
jgi:hypothetical protein